MFESSVKNLAIGCSLALSAVGLSAQSADAQAPVPAVHRDTELESAALPNRASWQPSGALAGYKLAPDAMNIPHDQFGLAFPWSMGFLGAVGGGAAIWALRRDRSSDVRFSHLVGVGLAGAASFMAASAYTPTDSIAIQTRVSSVFYTGEARYEYRGKAPKQGPFYDQEIGIPELPVPMDTTSRAPLAKGDAIQAVFYVNQAKEITGCTLRPSN